MEVSVGTAAEAPRGEFDIVYTGSGHSASGRLPLEEAASVAFEVARPVRSFPAFRGQRNNMGWWWVATIGRHVGYESWLERDHVICLDFDPGVVGLASQPFWLAWPDGQRSRRHAPDYFARLADGTGLVIDCRPQNRIRPRDAAAFVATEAACARVGWQYRLVGELEPVRMANLRWLAGYRHRRCWRRDVAAAAVALAAEPCRLQDLARLFGDPLGTLPVLFHLLWSGELVTNLSVLLSPDSVLAADQERR